MAGVEEIADLPDPSAACWRCSSAQWLRIERVTTPLA